MLKVNGHVYIYFYDKNAFNAFNAFSFCLKVNCDLTSPIYLDLGKKHLLVKDSQEKLSPEAG